MKTLLTDLTQEQLKHELAEMGQPAYRADQVWRGVYVSLLAGVGAMSNVPGTLRDTLAARWTFPGLKVSAHTRSRDRQTWKVLFELADGETIESVLMRYERRQTVCVSTQVGCAIGCPFCATGQSGFRRNLSPGEIVEQVLFFGRALQEEDKRVTHVVFMGMGEPLLNYDHTWQAVETLNDPRGFALGARHMTISTAGIVPGIDRLMAEPLQVGLSVSLHAAEDALRDRLVPVNQVYRLAEVLGACHRYAARTRRRITIEYAAIDGVNDFVEQAEALAKLLDGLLCHVNLIPLNCVEGSPWRPAPRERVNAFRAVLESHHIPATVRLGRGVDIQAGCGQLRQQRSAGKEP